MSLTRIVRQQPAACRSHGHKWLINVAVKASLKESGLASGEGYIELRGVEALRWSADGESPLLVLGRTCRDILLSTTAGLLRRIIIYRLGIRNRSGAGIVVGKA